MVAFAKPTPAPGQQTKVDHFLTPDQVNLFKEIERELKQLSAQLNQYKKDKNASKASLAKANDDFVGKSEALNTFLGQNSGKFETREVTSRVANFREAIATAKTNMEKYQKAVDDSQAQIDTTQAEIARQAIQSQALIANPQGTKVTTVGSAPTGTLLSADQNPAIAQTQLQLLFQQQRFQ
jgi:uncharacterized protein YlxW (UPF0749 family)